MSAWSAGSAAAERRRPLAEGRTAEVFAHGPDRVVKVLRPGFPDALGEQEAVAAALADRAAVGAPRFFGPTRVDGRFALVYERRDGVSMLERLVARPWQAGRLGARLGDLHAVMHGATAASLPDFAAAVRRAIAGAERHIGAETVARALERIERLPSGTALCHGDFHPGNVVISRTGPAVIDWLTAGSGPPAADVARTLFLLRDGRVPPEMSAPRRAFVSMLRQRFSAAYLRAYRRRRALDSDELRRWRVPTLVARLDEDVEHEREQVHALIAAELAEPDGPSAGSGR